MVVLRWAIIALFFASCGAREVGFSMCDCNDNATMYRRVKKVNYEVVEDNYYFNTYSFLNFTSNLGLNSPLIYDFDGSGVVDTQDYLSALNGFGLNPPNFEVCDVMVDVVNSHGWSSSYPDAYFCVVHITSIDESSLFTDACPLNTFHIDVIYLDSTLTYYFN